MARTSITNTASAPLPLPLPYGVILPAGGQAIVADSVATVLANLGGAARVQSVGLVVSQSGSSADPLTSLPGQTGFVAMISAGGAPSDGDVVSYDAASGAAVWASAGGVTYPITIANGGTNSTTALAGSSIMVSNGSAIVQGAAGTATTVLHGNAAGAPTYAAVSLTADVTGTLPVANGGSGATDAATARSNFGLAIGVNVAAYTLTPTYTSVTTATVAAPAATNITQTSHGADGATGQFVYTTENAVTGANVYADWKNVATSRVQWWMGSNAFYFVDPTSAQSFTFQQWTQIKPGSNHGMLFGGPSNYWLQMWSDLYSTRTGGSIASATTIAPTAGVHHVNGTTDIQTITPPANFSSGSITLIPDGAWRLITGGNIALGATAVVNRALTVTWDGTSWFPAYV